MIAGEPLEISRIVYEDHSIHGYVYEMVGEGSPWYSNKFLVANNTIKKIYLGGE